MVPREAAALLGWERVSDGSTHSPQRHPCEESGARRCPGRFRGEASFGRPPRFVTSLASRGGQHPAAARVVEADRWSESEEEEGPKTERRCVGLEWGPSGIAASGRQARACQPPPCGQDELEALQCQSQRTSRSMHRRWGHVLTLSILAAASVFCADAAPPCRATPLGASTREDMQRRRAILLPAFAPPTLLPNSWNVRSTTCSSSMEGGVRARPGVDGAGRPPLMLGMQLKPEGSNAGKENLDEQSKKLLGRIGMMYDSMVSTNLRN